MNLAQTFTDRFLKDASLVGSRNELSFWKHGEIMYIIADNIRGGLITKATKRSSLRSLSAFEGTKVFVTLFSTKEAFAQHSENICWGSYVWMASEPEHTIHFDNNPTVKPRVANS